VDQLFTDSDPEGAEFMDRQLWDRALGSREHLGDELQHALRGGDGAPRGSRVRGGTAPRPCPCAPGRAPRDRPGEPWSGVETCLAEVAVPGAARRGLTTRRATKEDVVHCLQVEMELAGWVVAPRGTRRSGRPFASCSTAMVRPQVKSEAARESLRSRIGGTAHEAKRHPRNRSGGTPCPQRTARAAESGPARRRLLRPNPEARSLT